MRIVTELTDDDDTVEDEDSEMIRCNLVRSGIFNGDRWCRLERDRPMDSKRGLRFGSKVGASRLVRDGRQMTPVGRVRRQWVRGDRRVKAVERNGRLVGRPKLGQTK